MRNPKYRVAATVAVLLAVAAMFCLYYYHHDPAGGHAPRCFFKMLTGYDCPGCGSQRAFYSLLHGDIAAAWSYNPFIFFAVPAAIFYIIVENGREAWPRLHSRSVHPAILTAILIAIIAWWLLRNLV